MKTLSRWTRLIFIALTASPSLAEMRYVWKENPGVPTSPYTNGWASAATTIQDAVDVSADGDTVLVANGVYDGGGRIAPGDVTLRTRLVVTNAVTVASVNGPETTLIVGQPHSVMTYDGLGDNAIRGAYLANGAVLSGFTVTNGFTRQTTSIVADDYCGGGIRCESDEATVTNCVIIGNMAAMRGGGIFQGTVVDCRIASNTVRTSNSNAGGGGIYGAAARTSLIEKNRTLGTSTDGGGTYGCTLDRCMLRGNSAGRHGGGAYLSTAVSCMIESNSATQ